MQWLGGALQWLRSIVGDKCVDSKLATPTKACLHIMTTLRWLNSTRLAVIMVSPRLAQIVVRLSSLGQRYSRSGVVCWMFSVPQLEKTSTANPRNLCPDNVRELRSWCAVRSIPQCSCNSCCSVSCYTLR